MKQRQTYLTLGVKSSVGLFLVKCYDNKIVELPISSIISPLSGPQVAKQQQQKKNVRHLFHERSLDLSGFVDH